MEIDRKTLKALAADTRLDILKSLCKRRKMPSELSKEMGLATSTVTEHLNRLEDAGLIRREETGHKWIYYNLTEKGSSLVRPKIPVNFIIVLSLCLLLVSAGFVYYYSDYSYVSGGASLDRSAPAPMLTQTATNAEKMTIEENATNATNTTNSTMP
jgi:DNA-binding transcriptional ArsR family regulator